MSKAITEESKERLLDTDNQDHDSNDIDFESQRPFSSTQDVGRAGRRNRLAVLAILLASLALNGYFLFVRSDPTPFPERSFGHHDYVYSPVPEPRPEIQTWLPGMEHTVYSGPPTNETDDAWHELYLAGTVVAIPKSEAAKLPTRTLPFPGDPDSYIGTVEVLHNLHCLNVLRMAVWPDRYPKHHKLLKLPDGTFFDHTDHCIQFLRQTLMCHADRSIIPYVWDETTKFATARFDTIHQCRNFDDVKDWAKQHVPKIPFNASVHQLDDLVFADETWEDYKKPGQSYY